MAWTSPITYQKMPFAVGYVIGVRTYDCLPSWDHENVDVVNPTNDKKYDKNVMSPYKGTWLGWLTQAFVHSSVSKILIR